MLRIRLLSTYIKNNILYSTKTYSNVTQSVEKYSNVFGKSAGDYLLKQINSIDNHKNIKIKQNTISKDLINAVLYPIKGLPIDLLESFLLKTKKRFPNSKIVNSILNSKFIKQHQKERSNYSKKVAIGNCLESMSLSNNDIFKVGQNRLNPIISTYSSDKERALSRLTSGILPAIFYANDAYNQSMMINNNKEEAKFEKKRRFKQEVARIGIMSYAQFVVLGALAKFVNKTPFASLATTTGIVVGTEMLSRVMTNKPVTFVKNSNKKDEEHPIVDMANDNSTIKHSNKISKIVTVGFALGGAIVALKSTKLAKNIIPKIKNKYNNFVQKDIYMTRTDFNSVIKKLNDNGFDKLADKYVEVVNKQKGDKIYLGKDNKKYVHTIVDTVLMSPVKAVYTVITAPFKMFSNKNKIVKNKNEDYEILKGLTYIKSIQDRKDFSDKLNKKLLSSFDNKTKTGYSNHNLAKYSKILTSGASSYFIVADSYNMVMQKENNKDNAKKISKKMFAQRVVNIGMGAYILSILSNAFKTQYNKSLYCVAAVSGAFGVLNEGLSRLVVGIPITEKTKEEQIKFKQKYSNFINKIA